MNNQQEQHAEEGTITKLLGEIRVEKKNASDQLFRRVYEELRVIARSRIRYERQSPADGEASDLVHEAYARLSKQDFQNRKHLFMSYALTMRNILIDRARRNKSLKRGGGLPHFSIDSNDHPDLSNNSSFNRLENTELFDKLRKLNANAAEVFELRLFGGLSLRDIAVILGRTEYDTRSLWNEALSLMKEWSDETV